MVSIPEKYLDENGEIDKNQLIDDLDLLLTDYEEGGISRYTLIQGIIGELDKRNNYDQ